MLRLLFVVRLIHLAVAFVSAPIPLRSSFGNHILAFSSNGQPSSDSAQTDLILWYKLVDTNNGDPYRNSVVFAERISPYSLTFEFCKVVAAINKNTLAHVDSMFLKVFASRDDLIMNKPVRADQRLSDLPITTVENPLYIAVPSLVLSPEQYPAEPSPLMQQRPISPERLKRWQTLNIILAKNKKSRTITEGTTATYSRVTWAEVQNVYDPVTKPYEIQAKPIPEETLDSLYEYLKKAGETFNWRSSGSETMRLHFIAPILVHVCHLFGSNIQILVDEAIIDGKNINVNGRVDFILRRGRMKRICIVQAKRDDMLQGLALNLLGCEAVADMEHLDCVYGIVTNYFQWTFVKSLNSRIERTAAAVAFSANNPAPNKDSLREIVGYIYAMLLE
jgi:hypothetical protein